MNRIPTSPNDPVNTDILMVAEDRVKGFRRLPFHAIAEQCGHPVPLVIERLKAMMEAGVVRRVRQTLLATKLAQGALVAWRVPEERLEAAFDWMKAHDPFTGHVVLRNTDSANPGADYRLWTTIKVPVGCGTLEGHCDILKRHVGADDYVLLPARGVFALGVGHMRRRNLQPGDKTPEPAPMQETKTVSLSGLEWKVLLSVKEQLKPEEMVEDPWSLRAAQMGLSTEEYCRTAEELDRKQVIGRFATFLEHVRAKTEDGPRHQIQRTVPLDGTRRHGNPGRFRMRTPHLHDPLLLENRGGRLRRRTNHGRGAWAGTGLRDGAQGRH